MPIVPLVVTNRTINTIRLLLLLTLLYQIVYIVTQYHICMSVVYFMRIITSLRGSKTFAKRSRVARTYVVATISGLAVHIGVSNHQFRIEHLIRRIPGRYPLLNFAQPQLQSRPHFLTRGTTKVACVRAFSH